MEDGSEGFTGPTRIGQIALVVEDLERATSFYRDVVGLEFLFSAEPDMAFFRCGDVRLMLSTPDEDGAEPAGSILYYEVDDLDRAHASLASAGAAVERAPAPVHRTESGELWMGFYRDSEGRLFATMEEREPTGRGGRGAS